MRIRTIKPEFFLHDGLFDAEKESGLPLRIAFIGLWCACDREGRFRWEPRRLGASILPYDGVDFSRVLDALVTRGFVVKHASEGVEFGVVPSFTRHQVINNRESPSDLPTPDDNSVIMLLPTRAPRVVDACPTPLNLDQGEGKGREGKGKEGKSILVAAPKNHESEAIYAAYPRKQARVDALRAITKALRQITFPELLEATTAFASAVSQWPESERAKFVPYPATWYNKGCWEDDRATWIRQPDIPMRSAAPAIPAWQQLERKRDRRAELRNRKMTEDEHAEFVRLCDEIKELEKQ